MFLQPWKKSKIIIGSKYYCWSLLRESKEQTFQDHFNGFFKQATVIRFQISRPGVGFIISILKNFSNDSDIAHLWES